MNEVQEVTHQPQTSKYGVRVTDATSHEQAMARAVEAIHLTPGRAFVIEQSSHEDEFGVYFVTILVGFVR